MSEAEFVARVADDNGDLKTGAIQPCLEIFLYGTSARESFADAVLDAAEALVRAFPGAAKFYRTNTMKAAKPVKPDARTIADNFLSADREKPAKQSGIELHAGAKAADFSLPSLQYFSTLLNPGSGLPPSRTFVRLCLPPNTDPVVLKQLCADMLQRFPVLGGHCGWSFYWGGGDRDGKAVLDQHATGWLARFPGVSNGRPLGLIDLVGYGQLTCSWLNFVGESAAQSRGLNLDALEQSVRGAGLTTARVKPDVLLIQAGDSPQTGDRNRQDLLPLYQAAGRVLAPLAIPDDMAQYQTIGGWELDERLRWYRRFFD